MILYGQTISGNVSKCSIVARPLVDARRKHMGVLIECDWCGWLEKALKCPSGEPERPDGWGVELSGGEILDLCGRCVAIRKDEQLRLPGTDE